MLSMRIQTRVWMGCLMGTPLLTPRLLGCACELILNCPKVLVSERRALVAALREIPLLNHLPHPKGTLCLASRLLGSA